MTISRFAKSIAYLAAAALLLLLSVIFQVGMHNEGGPETSYFRSNTFLFVVAIACIGTGVYSYIGYVRRHREHALDSLFLLLIGLVLLVSCILVFLNFGGLIGSFDQEGYTAVNINIIVLTVLPLPFLIRGLVLAFSTREDSRARRLGVQIAALLIIAGFVLSLAVGGTMRTMQYDPSLVSGEYGESSEEEFWV